MAESAVIKHSEIPHVDNVPGQKRKRPSSSASSSEFRRSKRGSQAAVMAASAADTAAFLESTVSIAQAAQDHVNIDDFSALAQASGDNAGSAGSMDASSTAAAALGSVYPAADEAYPAPAGAENTQHPPATSYDDPPAEQPDGLPLVQQTSPGQVHQPLPQPLPISNGGRNQQYSTSNGSSNNHVSPAPKPSVGSEEWNRLRKDNHKEVERRRREAINEGINELSKIVPGNDKSKGAVLAQSVIYIQQLREQEAQNLEKWTLEKLLTEQAITELSTQNEKLKQENEQLFKELESWKTAAQGAGVEPKVEPETSN